MNAERSSNSNGDAKDPIGSAGDLSARAESDHGRQLAAAALRAEVAERSRVAAAVHDDTVQVLVAILARLDRLAQVSKRFQDAEIETYIEDTRTLVRNATSRTRRLAFELWPVTLREGGLADAVRTIVEQTGVEIGAHVSISVTGERFSWDVEQVVFRTIQEAVANIRKHSRANHVSVDIRRVNTSLVAVVHDDGCGFDLSAARAGGGIPHMGLRTTAERVKASGGTIRIRSSHGDGTRVSFRLPIPTECSS
jgi:signal transduction histidine kinase